MVFCMFLCVHVIMNISICWVTLALQPATCTSKKALFQWYTCTKNTLSTVKHKGASAMETKGPSSTARRGRHVAGGGRRHFHQLLFIKATVVHCIRKQTCLWASDEKWHCCIATNDQPLPCNPSQVWLITAGRGLTSTANIWNAWIRCFWEITLYNFTQRRRKLPRLLGTCWPRKLISVLAKLDCTLIWMWSTASRGILFCHRLKTPGQSNKAGSIGT